MPKPVIFPPVEPKWLFDRDSVRFYALANGDVLQCLVSGEALVTHFGARGLSGEECLRAFNEHRDVIEQAARRKITDAGIGREVVLRAGDFAEPAARPPGKGPRLATSYPPEIQNDLGLRAGVQLVREILIHDLMRPGMEVHAEWEVVQVPDAAPLFQLTLTDDATTASAQRLFTRNDLLNLASARFSLFRVWDELLQDRGRIQLDALQDA